MADVFSKVLQDTLIGVKYLSFAHASLYLIISSKISQHVLYTNLSFYTSHHVHAVKAKLHMQFTKKLYDMLLLLVILSIFHITCQT